MFVVAGAQEKLWTQTELIIICVRSVAANACEYSATTE